VTPLLQAQLDKIDRSKRRSVIFLVDLNTMVHKAINYTIRMEPGVQTPEETLSLASGSCRDSAWLMVQLLRKLRVGGTVCIGLSDPTQT
jgi:transglutaminase-like putative cysteine protease